MRYQKANEILPEELVELIQSYIDGEYVYIPRKQENKRTWGQRTGAREERKLRDLSIYEDYLRRLREAFGGALLSVREKHPKDRASGKEK